MGGISHWYALLDAKFDTWVSVPYHVSFCLDSLGVALGLPDIKKDCYMNLFVEFRLEVFNLFLGGEVIH